MHHTHTGTCTLLRHRNSASHDAHHNFCEFSPLPTANQVLMLTIPVGSPVSQYASFPPTGLNNTVVLASRNHTTTSFCSRDHKSLDV